MGESVMLDLKIPPEINTTCLLNWKSLARREAVALWTPGGPVSVVSIAYAERVRFFSENGSLQIRSLTMADGGDYEVVMGVVPNITVLKNYTLIIFCIRITKKWWELSTCSLSCELSTGAKVNMTYTWTHMESGTPFAHSRWVNITMHPGDEEKSYTCTAEALGVQRNYSIFPYKYCSYKASGLFMLLCYCLAKVVLNPVPLFFLYYHHFKRAKSTQKTVGTENPDVEYDEIREMDCETDIMN
ncbi:uncharacterized protein LOC133374857 isoform X2 [Rhineura floridana]|nr:uncharacterized protein LOC133374857 isoform X2 [Rhineura floridana]XP_061462115.1 uncharacterized protein LOC133374857 isoform X2 [Rhineura floridana]